MSSLRSIAVLLAVVISNQGCMMQKVEDLADRYIPEANPAAPAKRICEARPTTRLELSGNLSSASAPVSGFSAELAAERASFRIDCTLYGEQANPVAVTLYFAALGGGAWEYRVQSSGTETAQLSLSHGQLRYDAEGALTSLDVQSALRLPRPNGTLGANVELWLGTPKSTSSDGLDGMISTAAPSSTATLEQDGYAEYRDLVCPDSAADD
jgi:hypothetical protein